MLRTLFILSNAGEGYLRLAQQLSAAKKQGVFRAKAEAAAFLSSIGHPLRIPVHEGYESCEDCDV